MKKRVRIYKAGGSTGQYINKTSQFLQKAQNGMELRSEQMSDVNDIHERVLQYIEKLLSDGQLNTDDIATNILNQNLGYDAKTVEAMISDVQEKMMMQQQQMMQQEQMNQNMNQIAAEEAESESVDEQPVMKYGGKKLSKSKFVKNYLKKAQEGMEQNEEVVSSTNDLPQDGREALSNNFIKGIQNSVLTNKAEQEYDMMSQDTVPETGMPMARRGRQMRNDMRKINKDFRRMFGRMPLGFAHPGAMMPYGVSVINPLMASSMNVPEDKTTGNESGETIDLPNMKIRAKRGWLGRLKEWEADVNFGSMPVNYMAGMMGGYGMPYGYGYNYGYNTGTTWGTKPGKVIVEKISETVNDDAIDEVADKTNNETANNSGSNASTKSSSSTTGGKRSSSSSSSSTTTVPTYNNKQFWPDYLQQALKDSIKSVGIDYGRMYDMVEKQSAVDELLEKGTSPDTIRQALVNKGFTKEEANIMLGNKSYSVNKSNESINSNNKSNIKKYETSSVLPNFSFPKFRMPIMFQGGGTVDDLKREREELVKQRDALSFGSKEYLSLMNKIDSLDNRIEIEESIKQVPSDLDALNVDNPYEPPEPPSFSTQMTVLKDVMKTAPINPFSAEYSYRPAITGSGIGDRILSGVLDLFYEDGGEVDDLKKQKEELVKKRNAASFGSQEYLNLTAKIDSLDRQIEMQESIERVPSDLDNLRVSNMYSPEMQWHTLPGEIGTGRGSYRVQGPVSFWEGLANKLGIFYEDGGQISPQDMNYGDPDLYKFVYGGDEDFTDYKDVTDAYLPQAQNGLSYEDYRKQIGDKLQMSLRDDLSAKEMYELSQQAGMSNTGNNNNDAVARAKQMGYYGPDPQGFLDRASQMQSSSNYAGGRGYPGTVGGYGGYGYPGGYRAPGGIGRQILGALTGVPYGMMGSRRPGLYTRDFNYWTQTGVPTMDGQPYMGQLDPSKISRIHAESKGRGLFRRPSSSMDVYFNTPAGSNRPKVYFDADGKMRSTEAGVDLSGSGESSSDFDKIVARETKGMTPGSKDYNRTVKNLKRARRKNMLDEFQEDDGVNNVSSTQDSNLQTDDNQTQDQTQTSRMSPTGGSGMGAMERMDREFNAEMMGETQGPLSKQNAPYAPKAYNFNAPPSDPEAFDAYLNNSTMAYGGYVPDYMAYGGLMQAEEGFQTGMKCPPGAIKDPVTGFCKDTATGKMVQPISNLNLPTTESLTKNTMSFTQDDPYVNPITGETPAITNTSDGYKYTGEDLVETGLPDEEVKVSYKGNTAGTLNTGALASNIFNVGMPIASNLKTMYDNQRTAMSKFGAPQTRVDQRDKRGMYSGLTGRDATRLNEEGDIIVGQNAMYGGSKYRQGGVYNMSKEDLMAFMTAGGEIEFL